MKNDFDVVIIGAGPAGSLAAARLRQDDLSVLVLEKMEFPRFVIGESLLPQSMDYLEKTDLLKAVEEQKFQVSLSFSGVFETIKIPYKSITSFTDPSINFGLKFSAEYEDYEENEDNSKVHANIENVSKSKIDLTEKVISLDAFRKTKNSDDLNKK